MAYRDPQEAGQQGPVGGGRPEGPRAGASPPAETGPVSASPRVDAADRGSDDRSLLLPLLVLGLGVSAAVLFGALQTADSSIGFGFSRLWFYLAGAGWPAAVALGLAAGIALLHRPISGRASAGLAAVGVAVALIGLLALVSGVSWDGLGRLPQSLILGAFSDIGIAILMGVVAAVSATAAGQPGDRAPTLPVLALVVGAVLIGCSNTMQVIVGGLGFLPVGERLAIGFSSFGLASGLLLLTASILLVLDGRRSPLSAWVSLVALAMIGLGLLGALIGLIFDDSSFAQGQFLRAGTGTPVASAAAIALAHLAGRVPASAGPTTG